MTDNNPDNENDNDNDNDNNAAPPRGLVGGILNLITTPLRIRTRNDRQNLIDQQQNQDRQQELLDLEEEIGIEAGFAAALFPEESDEEEDQEQPRTMSGTTYSLGGMSMAFDSDEPSPNTDYEVGVVLAKANRPAAGSDDERKLVEGICKNQYQKYKRAETSMKSIERLLQSRGIMDTITGTTTVLEKYDMKQAFTIVYPSDPTLKRVSLKLMFDGSKPQSVDLLIDFRKVSKDEVALSCAWWNLHGFFMDKEGEKQSLSRDMNWSYLHFKNHVGDNLYNDVNKQFLTYEKKQQGGPLFFKLLVDTVLSSNESSLSSLETTIKNYNIAKDGKDEIPEVIKTLEAGALTIQAMRDDGSERLPLPDKFVVDLLKVFQTTSVPIFNEKMASLHSNLDMFRLMNNEKTINTIDNLTKTFKMAEDFHRELFDEGLWEQATLESAKSTFIFWKNRCWNCKKENCNKFKCDVPIDEARCERNKQEWMKENNKDGSESKGQGRRSTKTPPRNWRPPEPHENNKRIIFGKPYTWNGRSSWVEDSAPSSGLPEAAIGANLANVPSQVPSKSSDDSTVATALTTATGLTQDQQNEMRRVSANLTNLGVSLATMKDFMASLTE